MKDITSNEKSKNSLAFSFVAFGGLVGIILSCLYGPNLISWWFEPPVEVGYNCRPATDWAMNRLILVQILSLFTGSLISLGIMRIFKRKS